MALEMVAPAFGHGRKPGVVAEWYAVDGSTVRAGEPVFRFESDYVAVEVEAEGDGVLAWRAEAGAAAAPGKVIAFILSPGEVAPEIDHQPEGDAMAATPGPSIAEEVAAQPANPGAVAQPSAESVLPLEGPLEPLRLLRRSSRDVDAPTPGGAWSRVFGDSQTFGADVWEAAVGSSQGAWPEVETVDEPDQDEPDQDGEPAASDVAAGAEADDFTEPLVDVEVEEAALEPIPFPRTFVEEEAATWDAAAVASQPSGTLTLKTTMRMTESRKVRDQLTREWKGAVAAPGDEDIFVRAIARAAQEHVRLASLGDAAGVVFIDDAGGKLAVLGNAARGSFRDQVAALARARDESDAQQCAFTVVSLAPFDIHEGTPFLPEGHAFALAAGAPQQVRHGEEVIPTLVMAATLAYNPDFLSMSEACRLLARFRELIEAPYALLAE